MERLKAIGLSRGEEGYRLEGKVLGQTEGWERRKEERTEQPAEAGAGGGQEDFSQCSCLRAKAALALPN
jgi:hypothetical protein